MMTLVFKDLHGVGGRGLHLPYQRRDELEVMSAKQELDVRREGHGLVQLQSVVARRGHGFREKTERRARPHGHAVVDPLSHEAEKSLG